MISKVTDPVLAVTFARSAVKGAVIVVLAAALPDAIGAVIPPPFQVGATAGLYGSSIVASTEYVAVALIETEIRIFVGLARQSSGTIWVPVPVIVKRIGRIQAP